MSFEKAFVNFQILRSAVAIPYMSFYPTTVHDLVTLSEKLADMYASFLLEESLADIYLQEVLLHFQFGLLNTLIAVSSHPRLRLHVFAR